MISAAKLIGKRPSGIKPKVIILTLITRPCIWGSDNNWRTDIFRDINIELVTPINKIATEATKKVVLKAKTITNRAHPKTENKSTRHLIQIPP